MTYWDNGHMDAGWGIAMMVGMLTFWVLVAVAIVWLVRTTTTQHAPTAPAPGSVTSAAEQILAERLARGEIDTEDYRVRLAAMKPSK